MTIKTIIFDLDGVLVKTKDIHYIALNKALKDIGWDSISKRDHISTFDGLSTMQKLEKIGIIGKDKDRINDLKQQYTIDELDKTIEKNDYIIFLFSRLKQEGYKICIASNAVRYTTQLVIFKLGLMQYVDHLVSNEDVTYKKPHSEMYLQCMIKTDVGPRETLIVEDSYIGRTGVYNSGANLCPVNSPDDVTYEKIMSYVNKYSDHKQTWNDEKLNILIPMAGAGSRFEQAGYTFPKPLVEVNGKPMIQVVIDNINIEANYIFIVLAEHYKKYNLKYVLESMVPGCKIVQVDGVTEGAACTTLLAKEYINNDYQLLIANSDQWVEWDSSHVMYQFQSDRIDGGILTFKNNHPKWSYAKVGKDGLITEVAEKKPISNQATVGLYFWKRGADYVKYTERMIEKDIRTNGEFYVAPVFNEAISDGMIIKGYEVDTMYGLGTPEDLDVFLNRDVK